MFEGNEAGEQREKPRYLACGKKWKSLNKKKWVNVIDNCSKSKLMPIIEGKVLEGSTIYSDGWKTCDGLILNGYEHCRFYHIHNEFAQGKSHINGIESFWSFAKRRLAKFNGLSDESFLFI